MGAPKGNSFWKLRSKHGRDKIFQTPEILWEAACEYFQMIDDNPWSTNEITTSDKGTYHKSESRKIPYTWEGLELFLDVFSLRDYKTNEDYKDFSQVITRIEQIIYSQKFTGAASGFFNANIIARDLGLRDEKKVETTGESTVIVLPSNGREQE